MSTKFFVNQSPDAGFEPPVYDIDPIRIGGQPDAYTHRYYPSESSQEEPR